MTNTPLTLPIDGNNKAINLPPNVLALAVTNSSSISGSTLLTLQITTSYIEVSAVSQGIFLKWGGVASSSSFDEYISPNTTRAYIVPTGQTTVQFIQQAATATLICIEK